MSCPKCHMEQDGGNLVCDYCGLVFVKLEALRGDALDDARVTVYASAPPTWREWLGARLFTP